ncbi:Hypothetical predicted protein [Pelobates cultripes]|uniref:Uncharacterized protein n=1 Tax=Pelobates cultripes TaxID=61616 RepID=A0AAD1RWA9_PELCU|nr:Hypothetical predicted protein [Pelobates cultripes]
MESEGQPRDCGREARSTPHQCKQHYKRPTEVGSCNFPTKPVQVHNPQKETPLQSPSLTYHISQITARAAVLHPKIGKAIRICTLTVAGTRLQRKSNTRGLPCSHLPGLQLLQQAGLTVHSHGLPSCWRGGHLG